MNNIELKIDESYKGDALKEITLTLVDALYSFQSAANANNLGNVGITIKKDAVLNSTRTITGIEKPSILTLHLFQCGLIADLTLAQKLGEAHRINVSSRAIKASQS